MRAFITTMIVALFPITLNAAVTAEIYDQGGNVNYQQLDSYLDNADKKQTKFVAAQDGEIIFSDKPIPKVVKNTYKPSRLADLGWRIQQDALSDAAIVTRLPGYQLVDNTTYQTPAIPEELPVTETVVTTAAASTPATTTESPITTALNKVLPEPLPPIDVSPMTTIIYLLGMIGIFFVSLFAIMLLPSNRKAVSKKLASQFTGNVGDATEMVGKGELFDFNRYPVRGLALPPNSTYLNMLAQTGKFENEGMSTYFYMAYYIPSQHAYAATLKKKKVTQTETIDHE